MGTRLPVICRVTCKCMASLARALTLRVRSLFYGKSVARLSGAEEVAIFGVSVHRYALVWTLKASGVEVTYCLSRWLMAARLLWCRYFLVSKTLVIVSLQL